MTEDEGADAARLSSGATKRANTQLPGSVPFISSASEVLGLLRETEILWVRGGSTTILTDILRIPDKLLVLVQILLEQPDILKEAEMFFVPGMRHQYRGFRQHKFFGVRQFLHLLFLDASI